MRFAHEVFPSLDKSVTLSGFIEHRWTSMRSEWSAVIGSSNENVAACIARLLPNYAVNFVIPEEANDDFAMHLVNEIEDVVSGKIGMQRWGDFASGYAAAYRRADR